MGTQERSSTSDVLDVSRIKQPRRIDDQRALLLCKRQFEITLKHVGDRELNIGLSTGMLQKVSMISWAKHAVRSFLSEYTIFYSRELEANDLFEEAKTDQVGCSLGSRQKV
jgi:hypothetical protein